MSVDPYATPTSNLIVEDDHGFSPTGSLTARKLRVAGWLGLLYVLVVGSDMALPFVALQTESPALGFLSDGLGVTSAVLWIYLLFLFRDFVAARFQVLDLNRYVIPLAILSVLLVGVGIALTRVENEEAALIISSALFALLVPTGVVTALLGKRLLKIETAYPYLRALCWTTIVSGVLSALVVLALLAVPVSMAADVLMALLFFRGAQELERGASEA